jgi:hypothetical protein
MVGVFARVRLVFGGVGRGLVMGRLVAGTPAALVVAASFIGIVVHLGLSLDPGSRTGNLTPKTGTTSANH